MHGPGPGGKITEPMAPDLKHGTGPHCLCVPLTVASWLPSLTPTKSSALSEKSSAPLARIDPARFTLAGGWVVCRQRQTGAGWCGGWAAAVGGGCVDCTRWALLLGVCWLARSLVGRLSLAALHWLWLSLAGACSSLILVNIDRFFILQGITPRQSESSFLLQPVQHSNVRRKDWNQLGRGTRGRGLETRRRWRG
jgi:hypothetical protein